MAMEFGTWSFNLEEIETWNMSPQLSQETTNSETQGSTAGTSLTSLTDDEPSIVVPIITEVAALNIDENQDSTEQKVPEPDNELPCNYMTDSSSHTLEDASNGAASREHEIEQGTTKQNDFWSDSEEDSDHENDLVYSIRKMLKKGKGKAKSPPDFTEALKGMKDVLFALEPSVVNQWLTRKEPSLPLTPPEENVSLTSSPQHVREHVEEDNPTRKRSHQGPDNTAKKRRTGSTEVIDLTVDTQVKTPGQRLAPTQEKSGTANTPDKSQRLDESVEVMSSRSQEKERRGQLRLGRGDNRRREKKRVRFLLDTPAHDGDVPKPQAQVLHRAASGNMPGPQGSPQVGQSSGSRRTAANPVAHSPVNQTLVGAGDDASLFRHFVKKQAQTQPKKTVISTKVAPGWVKRRSDKSSQASNAGRKSPAGKQKSTDKTVRDRKKGRKKLCEARVQVRRRHQGDQDDDDQEDDDQEDEDDADDEGGGEESEDDPVNETPETSAAPAKRRGVPATSILGTNAIVIQYVVYRTARSDPNTGGSKKGGPIRVKAYYDVQEANQAACHHQNRLDKFKGLIGKEQIWDADTDLFHGHSVWKDGKEATFWVKKEETGLGDDVFVDQELASAYIPERFDVMSTIAMPVLDGQQGKRTGQRVICDCQEDEVATDTKHATQGADEHEEDDDEMENDEADLDDVVELESQDQDREGDEDASHDADMDEANLIEDTEESNPEAGEKHGANTMLPPSPPPTPSTQAPPPSSGTKPYNWADFYYPGTTHHETSNHGGFTTVEAARGHMLHTFLDLARPRNHRIDDFAFYRDTVRPAAEAAARDMTTAELHDGLRFSPPRAYRWAFCELTVWVARVELKGPLDLQGMVVPVPATAKGAEDEEPHPSGQPKTTTKKNGRRDPAPGSYLAQKVASMRIETTAAREDDAEHVDAHPDDVGDEDMSDVPSDTSEEL